MGSSITNVTTVESLALIGVAAPFIGYGLTEFTGQSLYFILGASAFCLWMLAVPVLLLGAYKRNNESRDPKTTEETDASVANDA